MALLYVVKTKFVLINILEIFVDVEKNHIFLVYLFGLCGYYQNIKIASFLFFVKICVANIRVQKQPPRCSIYKAVLRKSYNVLRNAYTNLDYFLLLA